MSFSQGQGIPSGSTTTDRMARELAILLGIPAQDDSINAADLLAWGLGLANAYDRLSGVGDEFFGHLATQTLSAWEFRLGLPIRSKASDADRRAAIQAKRRAGGGDIRNRMLGALRLIDPTANVVTVSATNAAATSTPRQVFRFLITLDPIVLTTPSEMAKIRSVVDQMKPAYTGASYSLGRPFFLDLSPLDLTSL